MLLMCNAFWHWIFPSFSVNIRILISLFFSLLFKRLFFGSNNSQQIDFARENEREREKKQHARQLQGQSGIDEWQTNDIFFLTVKRLGSKIIPFLFSRNYCANGCNGHVNVLYVAHCMHVHFQSAAIFAFNRRIFLFSSLWHASVFHVIVSNCFFSFLLFVTHWMQLFFGML